MLNVFTLNPLFKNSRAWAALAEMSQTRSLLCLNINRGVRHEGLDIKAFWLNVHESPRLAHYFISWEHNVCHQQPSLVSEEHEWIKKEVGGKKGERCKARRQKLFIAAAYFTHCLIRKSFPSLSGAFLLMRQRPERFMKINLFINDSICVQTLRLFTRQSSGPPTSGNEDSSLDDALSQQARRGKGVS